MELHLRIIGIGLVALALIHVIFPRYFNWREELAGLSLVNREMMKIHTFFIALALLLMGVLCYTEPAALVRTELGRTICLGLAIFWGCPATHTVFRLFSRCCGGVSGLRRPST